MPESTREFGHFNADQHAAAQEPPVLVVGGLRYEGRLLSIEEWLPFADEVEQLRAREAPVAAWSAFTRRYLQAVFPRKRFRWWAPDPVEQLLRQPWVVVQEALQRFFDLQARAMSQPGPTTVTSGTGSHDRTAPSPSAGGSTGASTPGP